MGSDVLLPRDFHLLLCDISLPPSNNCQGESKGNEKRR